jgi:hypothetical protein
MSITPTGDRSGALAALGVLAGPQTGEEVPIRQPVVTVGKGKQNDVVLADDSVSTTHARIEYWEGAWRITDLNSANGTYVESVRLAPEVPTPLPYGSTVRFGGTRMHFRAVETADPDAARAAYTPPPPTKSVRERGTGLRIPVWLVALLLVLLVLAAVLIYNFTVAPTGVPTTPVPPTGPAASAALHPDAAVAPEPLHPVPITR